MAQPHLLKLETDYLDLRALLPTLVERKWVLLVICLLTLCFASFYVLFKPTKYQATVLLEVHHKLENSLGTLANNGQHQGSEDFYEEPISIQIALIYSKFILEPVIRSLGLDLEIQAQSVAPTEIKIYHFQVPEKFLKKRLLLDIDKPNHYLLRAPSNEILLEGYVNQLSIGNGFSVKINKLVAVSGSKFFITKKPESEIINKIRSNLVITDLSNSTEGGQKKAGILQLMMKGDNPEKLIPLINKIALFTQLKDKERKSLEAKKTLEFLDQQLPIVQASLKSAEMKLNEYRSTSGKIDIKLQTEYLLTHLSDLNKQLEVTRLKKMDMFQQYTSKHPFIISLDQKISEMERQRQEVLSQIKKLPAADQIAANLSREVNVKNALYTNLLHKIHEQQVVTAGIVSDIGILSLATFADKPLKPNWLIIILSSLFLGLILGSLGLIFWQIFTRRVNHPLWAEKNHSLENLIILPYSKNQATYSFEQKNNTTKTLPILACLHPNDPTMESLRLLYTVLQANVSKSHNNILAIMGISKNVGKTFIAANFASLLAGMHHKILVIDADIRYGHLHHYFDVPSVPGLTDVLNEEINLEAAIIKNTLVNNLDFLPMGKLAVNPTQLLMRNNFKHLLLELSRKYEYVLINTSPILTVTDGTFIGTIAGTNLLVLGSNKHESWEINIAIKNLRNAGVKLHGSIFNHLNPGQNKKVLY